jgi:hypothetical protein
VALRCGLPDPNPLIQGCRSDKSGPNENGAAPGSEDGAVKKGVRSGYFAAAYNAPTLFQSITFQTALR